MGGIDVAQHHIGIGDRGIRAAGIVTDRTGRGAGALRSDLHGAAGVDPQQRPAARTHFGQIDSRHLQRVSGAGEQAGANHDPAAHRILIGAGHLAIFDQRRLRGGAAHVERDRLGNAHLAHQRLHADDAGGRAGLDDVHRPRHRRLRSGQAAIGLHQQQRRPNIDPLQLVDQAGEIPFDDRHDVGVDHGRRGALVLLDLRQHLGADAQLERRRHSRNDPLDHLLVRRVHV